MKPITPKKVYQVALQKAVKAINKRLRQQRKLILFSGIDTNTILREMESNKKLVKDVVRQFEKAGWFVEVKDSGTIKGLWFRTEPKTEEGQSNG